VEQALSQARQELGPDAMLVNSRKTTAETRHLGEYEVVFAVDPPAPSPEPQRAPAASGTLTDQLAEMKRDLDIVRRNIAQSSFAPSAGMPSEMSDAFSRLTASDLPAELARDIVHAAAARGAGMDGLHKELESRFTVEPQLGCDRGTKIAALVGPPGAGKTTTLVKLAVNYGLAARRSTILLSMDTYRIAAADQLREYAAILGVPFQIAETPAALAQAIEEHRSKQLILIDTPGLGWGDMDAAIHNAQFLSTRPDIDIHLVLPASMKPGDLARTASAFDIFRPKRLLFTRLDETGSFGPLLGEAVRSGRPLSFFTTGQRIPEDMETAGRGRLVELVLGARRAAAPQAGPRTSAAVAGAA
jgi:flagellar biosynthesis protein FlhF